MAKTIRFPKMFDWQKEVFSKVISEANIPNNQTYVICSPRQVGKSFLLQSILSYFAITKSTTSVFIEPTFNQARKCYRSMYKMLSRNALIKSASGSTFDIELTNGSEINFRSAMQKDSLRGLTVSGILILDEAAYIPDDIYEIIQPFTNVHKAPTIMVSTPVAKSGFFWNAFNSKDNFVYYWNRTNYDMTPMLSDDLVQRYSRLMTPSKFKTEILGQFLDGESMVFGDFKSCIYTSKLSNDKPIYGGIDFGTGAGNDSTVITLFNQNKEVTNIFATNTLEPQEQIEWIADILNQHSTLKTVLGEKNSIGAVYLSAIQKKLHHKAILQPFNTTNDSKRTIIDSLTLAFQNHDIVIPDNKDLINQLSYYTMTISPTGKPIFNNAMDSIHDDYVMSLAIAYSNFNTGSSGIFGFGKPKEYRPFG